MNPESLRTKATITEGIRDYSGIPVFGSVAMLRYEPGNGYSYNIVLTPLAELSEQARGIIGAPRGSVLVTWIDPMAMVGNRMPGGVSMIVDRQPEAFLHYTYVREKLGCRTSDAIVLAELLGHLLQVRSFSCERAATELLNQEGGV
jgi:hypothetical protein